MAAPETVTVQLSRLSGKKEPFEVDLAWKVVELIDKISETFDIPSDTVKLLCKGKILTQPSQINKTLKQLKFKNNARLILMNKPQKKKKKEPEPTNTDNNNNINKNDNVNFNNKASSLDQAVNRKRNMEEIKKAAELIASRQDDGFEWNSTHYFEINDQFGQKINLPEEQRKALTVGLTLHDKGQKFMKAGQFEDALYILNLSFESLSKCDQKLLQMVDNYGLLALDIVWCYYLKQDEKQLTNAHKWLQIAEFGLKKAHGPNLERLKQVRAVDNTGVGEFIPELSLYVRLNILRAMQAFYTGDIGAAQQHLMTAEMDLRKLQISDLDLVKLQSMGFGNKESRRALRFCSGNIDSAVNWIYNKRDEKARKRREEQKRLRDRALQRKYGKTKNGKFVDLQKLEQLKNMGVEFEVSVEAMRQCDNVWEDVLNCTVMDLEKKRILINNLYHREMNDHKLNEIEQVLSVLGGVDVVSESRVRAALFLSFYDVEGAIFMVTSADPMSVVDLDRAEAHFVPYVEKRNERIRKENELREMMRLQKEKEEQERLQKLKEMSENNDNNNDIDDAENDANMEDNNENNDHINDDVDKDDDNDSMMIGNDASEADDGDDNAMKNEILLDDDDKEDDANGNIEAVDLNDKTMPNPNLGDVNIKEDDSKQQFVSEFDKIGYKAPDDDDFKIDQHILNDYEQDQESYLDLDLTTEQDALTNLKVLLMSMQLNGGGDDQQTFLSLFQPKKN